MNIDATSGDLDIDDVQFEDAVSQQLISNQTMLFSAPVAWKKVCFYEHVKLQPSLLLRSILPTPQGTSGCHRSVGDTSRCLYSDGGYLTKRITEISDGELLTFEIVEQTIRFHTFVKLLGGSIRVTPISHNTCHIEMTTRFQSRLKPLRLFNYFINKVIKSMHQIVLDDMYAECKNTLIPD